MQSENSDWDMLGGPVELGTFNCFCFVRCPLLSQSLHLFISVHVWNECHVGLWFKKGNVILGCDMRKDNYVGLWFSNGILCWAVMCERNVNVQLWRKKGISCWVAIWEWNGRLGCDVWKECHVGLQFENDMVCCAVIGLWCEKVMLCCVCWVLWCQEGMSCWVAIW